jgi:hypothetical protein
VLEAMAIQAVAPRRGRMRNLFWQISVTLDGLMEGPNRESD